MTASGHTKEPWHQGTLPGQECYAFGHDGVAVASGTRTVIRRIVACVSACAGVETETLEQLGQAGLVAIAAASVIRQRDELLKILGADSVTRQRIAGLRAELPDTKKGT